MKITVLTYLETSRSKTPDAVVDQVATELKAAGHEVTVLAVHNHLDELMDGLTRPRPGLVFNLMEAFNGDFFGDVDVAGFLDLLDLPHTGGGAGELYLQQDKAITKRLLASAGVRFPRYIVVPPKGEPVLPGGLQPPLFVKPLRLDASIGITERSLVRDVAVLAEQVRTIHETCDDSALVEEFIDGREFYVGVIGNEEPVALAPIELDFSGLPEGAPRVADSVAKWVKTSARYKGTKSIVAELPDRLARKMKTMALAAYRVLQVRDYGRVDMRMTDDGDLYVIEVNCNCYLERSSEFVMAAEASGIGYHDLITRITDLAMDRYRHRKQRRPRRAPAPTPPAESAQAR